MLADIIQHQIPALLFIITLGLGYVLTRVVLWFGLRFGWTASSNARSSHLGQLTFGGGALVIFVSLGVWFFVPPLTQVQIMLLVAAEVLGVVSWMDD